jgi:replicative DNA helicase
MSTALTLVQGGLDVAAGMQPPHDLEAEAAVLSAVMLDPSALARVADLLRSDMFYSGQHALLFGACLALRLDGQPTDVLTVESFLDARKRLPQAGGRGFLGEVLLASPHVENVVAHATAVHSVWRAREILHAARRILAEGYSGYGDIQEFADRSSNALDRIARESLGKPLEPNLGALKRIFRGFLEHAAGSRTRGIPYGIPGLDKLTAGMHSAHKITICAMTGRGKTVMGMGACIAAAKAGAGSLFFTTEMTRDEMLLRLVAAELGFDTTRFRDQKASPAEWQDMFLRLDEIAKMPIEIIEAKDMRIDQVAAASRRYADGMLKTHGVPLGVVCHDYVQRMPPPNGMGSARKYDVVSENTKGLKKIAQELKIPVVELAQMRKLEVDKVSKVRETPSTGAVADSQEIEKESDVVIYLYRRPIMHNGKARGEDVSAITCALDKQRGGPPGEVQLVLEGHCQRFREEEPEPGVYRGAGQWYGDDER